MPDRPAGGRRAEPEIRLEALAQRQRFVTCARIPHNPQVGFLFEELANSVTDQGVVVGDYQPDGAGRGGH